MALTIDTSAIVTGYSMSAATFKSLIDTMVNAINDLEETSSSSIGTSNVSVSTEDDLTDTSIDMPAESAIDDKDLFGISIGKPNASYGYSSTFVFSGKDWKGLSKLTSSEESATDIGTSLDSKLITFFFRFTTGSSYDAGQTQANGYIAKGSDGVSVFYGDNHVGSFDPNPMTIWKFGAAIDRSFTVS